MNNKNAVLRLFLALYSICSVLTLQRCKYHMQPYNIRLLLLKTIDCKMVNLSIYEAKLASMLVVPGACTCGGIEPLRAI